MTTDVGITVKLSGTDQVKGGLDQIRAATKKLSDESSDATKKAKELSSGLGGLKTAAVGLVAAFGVQGIANYFGKIDDALTSTVKLSRSLDIGAGTLEKWQYAASSAGVGATEFQNTLKGIAEKAGEALINPLSDSARAFAQLGVSIKDQAGNFRGVEPVFKDMLNALAQIPDPATRSRLALVLLGPAGKELADSFREGAGSFQSAASGLTSIEEALGPEFYANFKDANGIVKDFTDTVNQLATIGYVGIVDFFDKAAKGAALFAHDVGVAYDNFDKLQKARALMLQDAGVAVVRIRVDQPFDFGKQEDPAKYNKPRFQSRDLAGELRNAQAAHNQKLKEARDLTISLQQARDDDSVSLALNNKQIEEGAALYEATFKPQQKIVTDLERANVAFHDGSLSASEYADVVSSLQDAYAQADDGAKSFADTITNGLRDAITSGGDLKDKLEEIGKSLLTNLAQTNVLDPLNKSLTSLFAGEAKGAAAQEGSKVFIEEFKNAFTEGTSVFASIWTQGSSILGEIFSGFGGVMSYLFDLLIAGIGALISSLNLNSALSFLPFATGGEQIVSRPTLIMAGERGPERLNISPMAGGMGTRSGGGSGVTVNIPRDSVISGISAGSFARHIARQIRQMDRRTV